MRNRRVPVVRDERPMDEPHHPSLTPTDRGATRRPFVYAKGDKVVYPHHGAAVVESVVEREGFGQRRAYLKLRLPRGLTIMVPVDSAQQVGLRRVARRKNIDEVFDLLRQEEAEMAA